MSRNEIADRGPDEPVVGGDPAVMAVQKLIDRLQGVVDVNRRVNGQGTSACAEELQSLVAPIALYPDALVAQILNAATFADQVAVANYWVQQNKTPTGSALMTAVDKQTWDPSVKALT